MKYLCARTLKKSFQAYYKKYVLSVTSLSFNIEHLTDWPVKIQGIFVA